ncbi:MAG: hypothetical protein NTX50_30790 [Candidatus Sumerlaeota bacterium]|nr:hypothetical protein [Candidatus Sumerlaeota bacterium]
MNKGSWNVGKRLQRCTALVVALAALALAALGVAVHAAQVMQDTYVVSLGTGTTTGTAQANYAGFAKRAYVTASNLGTTCTVAIRTSPSLQTLSTSDALSTGTSTVSLSDLPVAEPTEWLVTAGAAMSTTRTVSIQLYYDANK